MGELIISFFKLVGAILLLPVVIAGSLQVQEYIANYQGQDAEFLIWGGAAFLIIFLFVNQFRGLHELGQKTMSALLKFMAPLDLFVANSVPFYTIVIVFVYWFVDHFYKLDAYHHYLIFFVGFSFCMHVVSVAQNLQEQDQSIFKPNYFPLMSIFCVLNIFIIVLLLDMMSGHFMFGKFFHAMIAQAWDIYTGVYDRVMMLVVKGK